VADANEAVDLGPAGEAPSDIIEAPSPPAAKGDPIIIAAARKVLECKWSRDSPEYTCDAMKTWNDLDALEHGAGDTTLVALLTDPDERLQYLGAASLQAFSSYTTNRRLAERVLDRLETEEGGEELLRVLARAAAQISPTRTGLEARYKALPKKLTVPVAREEFIGKAQFSNSELMFDITLELARRDPSDLVRHAAVGAFWTGTPADRRDEVCELWLDTALDEKARRRLQTHAAYLAFSASTGCTRVFDRLLGHVSTKLAGSQDDLDWVNPLVYLAGNDKATAAQRAKATATLERIAADPASLDYVRARAMEGVIAGDPTGAKSYLSRMLGDPSERVKQAADRLLKKLASEPKKP
jgi:hypothetical protein